MSELVKDLAILIGGMLFAAVVAAVIFGVPVWLLWNWLMPEVFGLPRIGLVESLGLMLLFGILLGRGGSK